MYVAHVVCLNPASWLLYSNKIVVVGYYRFLSNILVRLGLKVSNITLLGSLVRDVLWPDSFLSPTNSFKVLTRQRRKCADHEYQLGTVFTGTLI